MNYKSDIYKNMDKMIENIKKFRNEFQGDRKPQFLIKKRIIPE